MIPTLQERIAYFVEDAEARVEEVLPMSGRVALAVSRLEMIEKRIAAIEERLSIDVATVLTTSELASMAAQEETLSWVRQVRAVAKTCVTQLMSGNDVDPSAVEWPAPPTDTR